MLGGAALGFMAVEDYRHPPMLSSECMDDGLSNGTSPDDFLRHDKRDPMEYRLVQPSGVEVSPCAAEQRDSSTGLEDAVIIAAGATAVYAGNFLLKNTPSPWTASSRARQYFEASMQQPGATPDVMSPMLDGVYVLTDVAHPFEGKGL